MILEHLKQMNVNNIVVRTHIHYSVLNYKNDLDIGDEVPMIEYVEQALNEVRGSFRLKGVDEA